MIHRFTRFVLFFLLITVIIYPRSSYAISNTHLVLIGGGLKDTNSAVYSTIINLAGGSGVARIGIITAASIPESADPDAGTPEARNARSNGEFYAALFESYGAIQAEWIPIDLDHISNNASPAVLSQIDSMSGFFFGGGDQSRLIQTLMTANRNDSPALAHIRTGFNNGKVVAGTSAGTAIMVAGPMITGGESYEALRYGSYTTPYNDDLSYDPQGGFRLFSYGILDTHFSERGRQGRIIRLAADTHTPIVYGIDENTALVVRNATTSMVAMEVIGAHGVSIFDLRSAIIGTGSYWSIQGVLATHLTAGDTYNPLSNIATIASTKSSLNGREYYDYALSATRDIFSSPNNSGANGRRNPREFVHIATDLFDSYYSVSTYGLSYERNPRFKVVMTKSNLFGSQGFQGYVDGVNTYSYINLLVDIARY